VMLESNQHDYAADMFNRVLSADPEDLLAWVAMSEIHNQRGQLDVAVWYLERAFELASDNQIVEEELRHLYGHRDGIEPQRVQLTRGALARLYIRGDLLSRAIKELRALLDEQPERVDISIALAEALWRNGQRLEASEICHQILDEHPYCLKANLILGQIWTSSGREEGQMYLRRAEALDPDNKGAHELFGPDSPLPARQVQITPLERQPLAEEERPTWMAEVEAVPGEKPLMAEPGAAVVDVTAALEPQIEIPSWLEELTVGEEVAAPQPPGPAELPEERPLEEIAPAAAEEIPEWLPSMGEVSVGEELEAVTEEETPEWLSGLGLAPVEEEKVEEPGWLAEPGIEPTIAEEAPAAAAEEEIPEWLTELGAEAAREKPIAEAEEVAMPAWLEGEGLPSGEDALAWLEQLAEGKEEELRAQAQAEAEARMVEIMGRPRPAEPALAEAPPEEPAPAMPTPAPAEVPEWLQELAPQEAVAPEAAPPAVEAAPEEVVAPPVEEPFGWTAFGEPEAPPEALAAVEEAPPVEEAVPPQVPEMAYPEEVEAPPVAEVPMIEEIPTPEITPPPEEIRWGGALETLPEEEIAPAPVVEEMPGVMEMEMPAPDEEAEEMPEVMEIPAPAEEAEAPPEIPIIEAPAEPFATERAHLKEHPRDYEAWITLARALWQAGEQQEALAAYIRVIRAGKLIESVIPDLEAYGQQWPDVSIQQALGDAYMKAGRLQEALNIYRQALESL